MKKTLSYSQYIFLNFQGDVELLKIADSPAEAYELCTIRHAPDCGFGTAGSQSFYNRSTYWENDRGSTYDGGRELQNCQINEPNK